MNLKYRDVLSNKDIVESTNTKDNTKGFVDYEALSILTFSIVSLHVVEQLSLLGVLERMIKRSSMDMKTEVKFMLMQRLYSCMIFTDLCALASFCHSFLLHMLTEVKEKPYSKEGKAKFRHGD